VSGGLRGHCLATADDERSDGPPEAAPVAPAGDQTVEVEFV